MRTERVCAILAPSSRQWLSQRQAATESRALTSETPICSLDSHMPTSTAPGWPTTTVKNKKTHRQAPPTQVSCKAPPLLLRQFHSSANTLMTIRPMSKEVRRQRGPPMPRAHLRTHGQPTSPQIHRCCCCIKVVHPRTHSCPSRRMRRAVRDPMRQPMVWTNH